jgi:hypothetical protein
MVLSALIAAGIVLLGILGGPTSYGRRIGTVQIENIEQLRLQTILGKVKENQLSFSDVSDLFESGQLPGSFFHSSHQSHTAVDLWGRPYCAVQLDGGQIGLYSNGVDGKSETAGNDPDDISTWKQTDFYRVKEGQYDRKQTIVITLCEVVICFGLFYLLGPRAKEKR